MDYPPEKELLWHLNLTPDGGHIWSEVESESEMTESDKFWLGQTLESNPPDFSKPAHERGFDFFKRLQCHDGHWAGEYGGPMFLLPSFVVIKYATRSPITPGVKRECIRYLLNVSCEDGGWGLHVEGQASVYGTTLNYVSLRLMGVEPEHPVMLKARRKLMQLGGAEGIPSWGKSVLSILSIYSWDALNPVPPELWLLPEWVPFHPSRWWIHSRNVYIPISVMYGLKWSVPLNKLTSSIQKEIFVSEPEDIDWVAIRGKVAPSDLHYPPTKLFKCLNSVLNVYQSAVGIWPVNYIRQQALKIAYKLVCDEDTNTTFQCLAPVNKAWNSVTRFAMGDLEAWESHEKKFCETLWMGPEGMRMTGTNGSQLWDTAFTVQALVATGLAEKYQDSVISALKWLDQCQIRENPPLMAEHFRHPTKGAWPFSTKEQAYTVSDTTAEALKAVIQIQNLDFVPELVSLERQCDAVDIILSLQNPCGGWASYELVRGGTWMEWLNPAEVFGRIMVEYTYPECSTSALTALLEFQKHSSQEYRSTDIQNSIKRGLEYVRSQQLEDGSWYGSWGICFTYATMFALEALGAMGETYENSASVRRACDFLLSKQMSDGGWGETYKSCETRKYSQHKTSQVVQTSWAVMGLLYASYPVRKPIERAVALVKSRQQSDGSWLQESMEGIFNETVTIAYPNFKFCFSIWMLGLADKYLGKMDKKTV